MPIEFDFVECITTVAWRAMITHDHTYYATEMEEWVEDHGGRIEAQTLPVKVVFDEPRDAFAFKVRWL